MASVDTTILLRLLEAAPNYVSGSILAEELGLSRVSIWGHLEKLNKAGFCFEAIRNKGYRLLSGPYTIHKNFLEAYMLKEQVSSRLHYLSVVDSTMTEAEHQLAMGCEDGLTIVASKMTRGRGRRGRSWLGEDLGNLYLTFAFRPDMPLVKMQRFTLWIGASLCEILNKDYGIPLQIKWPNDLMYAGRKCAGILTESRVQGDKARDIILGIGINVNSSIKDWPEELQQKAISLEAIVGRRFNMNALAAHLIGTVQKSYQTFISGSHEASFEALWACHEYLRGQEVIAQLENETVNGRVIGLGEQGNLILALESGKEISLEAAEVTLAKSYKNIKN